MSSRESSRPCARGDGDAEGACGGAGAQALAQRNRVVEVHAYARQFAADRVHRLDDHPFEPDLRGLLGAAEFEREAVRRFDHRARAQIECDADAIEARPEIGAGGGNADDETITQRHMRAPVHL